MKRISLILILGFCTHFSIEAQVKIGDNPQNIDASSVLELESTDKVLVISRVTTAQMNAIVPLQGALVYNNDVQSVFYFDGNQWVNLKTAGGGPGGALSADPIVNSESTIVITPTGTADNLEVAPNSIDTSHIRDGSITGSDISDGSIGPGKIQDLSITQSKISENSVGPTQLDNANIGLEDFSNANTQFITVADIISAESGNVLEARADGAFYNDDQLILDIADVQQAITDHVTQDLDTSTTNEIQNLTLDGTLLGISNTASTINLAPLLGAGGTDNQNLGNATLDGNNVLTIEIENGNETTVDLSSLAGGTTGGTDNQNLGNATLDAANVLTIEIESGNPTTVDLSPLAAASGASDDQNIGPVVFNENTGELSIGIEDGNAGVVDLSALAGGTGGTDDQNLSLSGNEITIEDGNTIDLTPILIPAGSTDDQNMGPVTFDVTTNELSIGIEDGNPATVDLSALAGGTGGTDDQNLTLSGNEITIEDGNTIDLTPILGSGGGTDDQNLTLSGNEITIEDGNTIDLTPILGSGGGTDDQNIDSFDFDETTNELSIAIEDGNLATVDLSVLAGGTGGTDDQNLGPATLDASNLLTIEIEGGNETSVDLSSLAGGAGGTDDQNISGSTLTGTELTIGIEGGTSETIDLASIANTDSQSIENVTLDGSNILSIGIENGNPATVDLSSLAGGAGGTDDQNLGPATLNASNLLTIEIEGGNATTVDLSSLAGGTGGTDDQTATEVPYDNTSSGLTALDTQAAIDEIAAAGSTDDQALSIDTSNVLTLEDGGTVDLTPFLDNSDDQNANEVPYDNTASGLTALDTQAAIDEIAAAGSTDDQALSIDASNVLTLEDGGTVDLTPFLDNTDDQTATDVSYDGATSGLAATTTQDAIDEIVAAGNSDDQNISGSNLTGTDLTIGIEGGTSETIDLSSLVGTDDQTATEVPFDPAASGLIATNTQAAIDEIAAAGNTDDQNANEVPYDPTASGLTATDTQAAIDEIVVAGSTDDQALSIDASNVLTLEDGGTVDLTPFLDNTDNQTATDVSYDSAASGLAATTTQEAIDEIIAGGSTDNQALTIDASNVLTLEDGGTVNLAPFLDNTDDQALTIDAANVLTLEDGGTVNLTPFLDNTDDQALTIDAANVLTLEDGGTVDLAPFLDNTDDQQLNDANTVFDDTTNTLTIELEDGGTATADLSALAGGTDDQALRIDAANVLTLEDGGTVNLAPFLDNTDDQQLNDANTVFDAATNTLTIELEDGGTATADLSALAGSTDDQALTIDASNVLTLEDGGTVNLAPFLDNTDDQALSIDASNVLTLEDGGTVNLAPFLDNSDDQALTIDAANVLTLEDGGAVNLAPFLDNSDDQALTIDAANILTLEDGGTVNLTPFLDNTDDQQLNDANTVFDAATNTLTIELEDGGTATADLSALAGGTDDQALSIDASNVLTLEDGGTVNLAPFLDNTDDQQLNDTNTAFDATNNILTIEIEDGGTATADFTTLANASSDDQNLTGATLTGTNLQIDIEGGNSITADLSDLADDQTAAEVPYDPSTSGLVATDAQAAIDEIIDDHEGEPNNIFFADADGSPTDTQATTNLKDNGGFYWDGSKRFQTGALYLGMKLNGNNDLGNSGILSTPGNDSKLVVAERYDFPGDPNFKHAFPVQLVNESNSNGTGVGMLFAVDLTGNPGKGALLYERQGAQGQGNFHFISSNSSAATRPTINETVLTIENDGDVILTGNLIDKNGGATTVGQVLTNTVNGTEWADAGAADDDITGVTLDASSILTINEGTTSVTEDLSTLEESTEIAAVQTDVNQNEADADAAIALKEDAANKSTDGTLAGNSDVNFPTEQAVKTYVDNQISASADDDITGVNLSTTNILTIQEGTTTQTVDLGTLDNSSAIATLQTDVDQNETDADNAIAANATAITTNATALSNHITADGDTDDTNELSDIEISGTTIQLTNPAAGATGVNLDNTFATDSELATASTDLFSADLTLSANRTHNLNNNTLIFGGTGPNSQIGIGDFGNTGPASVRSKFDVDGQITASNGFASSSGTAGNPAYGFYTGTDTDMGMYRAGVDRLGFSTNGIDAMQIDANQNVGVNNTNPSSKLHTSSFATAILVTPGAITLNQSHHTVILGGNHNITLPSAATCIGRMYIIKNTTVNTPNISTYIDDFGANISVLGQGVLHLQSDGSNWQQIN